MRLEKKMKMQINVVYIDIARSNDNHISIKVSVLMQVS